MKWFSKKKQREVPDITPLPSIMPTPAPEAEQHSRTHKFTPNEYIPFCKENCDIDCIHRIKNEELNFFFYGACLFYEDSLCIHSKNPDTMSISMSHEESRKFFEAEHAARKAAGLENKPGAYSFICPNCQTLCYGSWVEVEGYTDLHGSTGCPVCKITLMV